MSEVTFWMQPAKKETKHEHSFIQLSNRKWCACMPLRGSIFDLNDWVLPDASLSVEYMENWVKSVTSIPRVIK